MKQNHFLRQLFIFVAFTGILHANAQKAININETSIQQALSLKSQSLSIGKDMKGVTKQRLFQHNKQLSSLTQENKGDTLLLDFFENKKYKAIIKNLTKHAGRINIVSQIADTEFGYCYITLSDKGITISAELPAADEMFRAATKSGQTYLFQSSMSAMRPDALPESCPLLPENFIDKKTENRKNSSFNQGNEDFPFTPPVSDDSVSATEQPIREEPFFLSESDDIEDGVIIDLLVVYTPAAEAWANSASSGVTDMNDIINLGLLKSNETMQNSQTGITFRIVHTHKTNYSEADSSIDLERITNNGDGYMDEVHGLRDQYNADVVVFIPSVTFTGGLAWLLNSEKGRDNIAFALSRVEQTSWTYTMVHEIGHNMGCSHHKLQGGSGLYSYSFGWGGITNSGTRYSTIMTYENGSHYPDGKIYPRIPYFSDPNKYYEGVAIGAQDANNVLTLKKTKHVTSRYRVAAEDNADLASISLSSGQLNPVFDKAYSNYTVKVSNTTDKISIGGTPENTSATVSGAVTDFPLTLGENVIKLTVTAPSGLARIYTITVIRLEPMPAAAWGKQNSGVTTALNSIQMLNETTGYICGDNGIILKTSDGGKNWIQQTSGTANDLKSLSFLSENVGFIAGNNGIVLKTINAGKNWTVIFNNIAAFYEVNGMYVESENEIYFMCNNGLFLYNGSNNLTTVLTYTNYGLCKPNSETFAIGAYTNGINYTKDKFTTYYGIAPQLTTSVQFYGISTWQNSNVAIACGKGGAIQKADFTAHPTQKPIASPTANNLNAVNFASQTVIYAVGANGTVLKSTDQGEFWSEITPAINTQNLNSVSFVSEDKGWMVGAAGTILYISEPELSVSPTSQKIASEAGSSVDFAVASNLNWTVDCAASWLTVIPDVSTGTITATANQSNPTTNARSANMTVSAPGMNDIILNVTQDGSEPLLTVSPNTEQTIGAEEGSYLEYRVTTTLEEWNAVGDANWLTVTPEFGDKTIRVTASKTNPATTQRSASVLVSGTGVESTVLTIIQEASFLTSISTVENTAIVCYPNPVVDELYLKTDKRYSSVKITLFNSVGASVYSKTRALENNDKISIPNNLNAGIYYLHIQNQENNTCVFYNKIVKVNP